MRYNARYYLQFSHPYIIHFKRAKICLLYGYYPKGHKERHRMLQEKHLGLSYAVHLIVVSG